MTPNTDVFLIRRFLIPVIPANSGKLNSCNFKFRLRKFLFNLPNGRCTNDCIYSAYIIIVLKGPYCPKTSSGSTATESQILLKFDLQELNFVEFLIVRRNSPW